MRKLVFVFFIAVSLFGHHSFSQDKKIDKEFSFSLQDVMKKQSFDVDMPEYRKAENITKVLIDEFKILYSSSTEDKQILDTIILLRSALKSADIIGMDYSMFANDIKYLEELSIELSDKLNQYHEKK